MDSISRDGGAEIKRAIKILEQELAPELRHEVLAHFSPGDATVVNTLYESGVRGNALDPRRVDFTKLPFGSSSCALDFAEITADGHGSEVKYHFPVGLGMDWASDFEKPGWPHRPCVRIFKTNGSSSVTYFDRLVDLVDHQYRIFLFFAEWSQRCPGPVPDYQLQRSNVTDADLAPIMSRIRGLFKETAHWLEDERVRQAAVALIGELIPEKTPLIGYRIGRPKLIQIE